MRWRWRMSKKIIYIKILIAIICLLFIGLFVLLFNNIQESINVDKSVVEETSMNKEEIVFDMTLPPSKQRNLKGHVKEYMSQVYDYLYKDIKWKNIQESNPYDYSGLRKKKDREDFYKVLQYSKYGKLFLVLFNSNNEDIFKKIYLSYPLNLDDIPVTENYKQKHPKQLYEEFDFIKKEDYETKKKYDNNLETDTWLYLSYKYGIGVNENEKLIYLTETKNVMFLYESYGETKSRVVFDEEGNEMTEDTIDTRKFVFKYTIDDNGYVDDVEFVKEIKLADDKYLDELWKNVRV